MGITLGRFVSGFLTIKLSSKSLINLGLGIIAMGVAILILPLPAYILPLGFLLIGTGCAPIYPSVLHETPNNFGRDISQALMGVQMGFAYVGTTLMPPLCGLLIGNVSPKIYPYYLLIFLGIMFIMLMSLHRITIVKSKKDFVKLPCNN